MKKLTLIIILSCLLFTSCHDEVEKVYRNRTKILDLFNGVTIIRRGNLLHLGFKKDSLTNFFTFEETKKSNLIFITDSIQFELNFLENYDLPKWSNKREFESELQKRAHFLLSMMKKYDIKGIDNEFRKFGIALYIYMPQKIVLYVPNIYEVKNNEWLSYIKSANKIDENWYWREYEHE